MTDETSSGAADVGAWGDLIAFQPSEALTTELNRRGYVPRPITTAEYANVNLDRFGVRVTQLPTARGRRLTPDQLLSYIRKNLNSFVDERLAGFRPARETDDGPRWRSSRPCGAVVVADLKMWKLTDEAPLVCSQSAPDFWRFTTLGLVGPGTGTPWRTGHTLPLGERTRRILGKTQAVASLRGSHPISGTREFGVRRCGDGAVEVYTRAADGVTDFTWSLLATASALVRPRQESIIYAKGDALWTTFQARTAKFVNDNDGRAEVIPPRVLRPSYDAIRGLASTEE